jgi:hypothetical protein
LTLTILSYRGNEMSNNSGYVYILINPATPGLVKIGKTTRSPEERARELSSATGVPEPFILVYKAFFQDCSKGEEFVHEFLSNKRISKKREFFRISNTEAINAVVRAEREIGSVRIDDDENLPSQQKTNNDICQEILETADDYLHGRGEILKDEDEAEAFYKKAIKLGCLEAYHSLGYMHYQKYIDSETKSTYDLKQAIKYYKEGTHNGNAKCWGDLAICYGGLEEYANADKCWLSLLTSPSMKENKSLNYYLQHFMNYMGSAGRRKQHEILEAIFNEPTFSHLNGTLPEKRFKTLENFYQEVLQGLKD